jgi:hypothetical protein
MQRLCKGFAQAMGKCRDNAKDFAKAMGKCRVLVEAIAKYRDNAKG